MSLLLDALKKAAEDKEKNGLVADTDVSKAEKNSTEDYPEIDEELIAEESVSDDDTNQYEKNESVEQEEDFDLELPEDAVALESEAPEQEPQQEQASNNEVATETDESEPEVFVEMGNTSEPGSEASAELAPKSIQKANSEKMEAVDKSMKGSAKKLPAYDHSDARKILGVAQKRYRNKQRLGYYGLYAFAVCLFFAGSYLYYTTEILDNSDRPVFQAKNNASSIPKTQKEIKIEKQVSVAKAKLAEMDVAENKQVKVAVPEKKKVVVAAKQKQVISIIKQKKEDPISVLLYQAYAKYQSGQYDLSNAIYQKVLRRDPRQYDALLGGAAIAVIKKDYTLAREYYQRLLRYYPRDSIAKAALVDLARQELTVANETQLKTLKRANPKAAHIHFSLGLLYARKNRIKESQQAFFDAYALDKRADYAYNLAVMLDKLGQPKAALSYYKQASNLSDNSVTHFNEKLALDRISQLEGE